MAFIAADTKFEYSDASRLLQELREQYQRLSWQAKAEVKRFLLEQAAMLERQEEASA